MRNLGIGPVGTLLATGVLEERDLILLADFENRTTDSGLGVTITEAFRIDLSQSRVVRLVEPATVVATLERMELDPTAPLDSRLAREVAERQAIKVVVTGEVAPIGSGYVLSASLISPADGALLVGGRVTARDDTELIGVIDRLSRQMRERIGESLKGIRASPPLEQVTTPSTEALRLYSDGVRASDIDGDQRRAVNLLGRAVAIDSAFAMAYRKLGAIYGNLGRRGPGVDNLTKAFQLRERLPDQERYHAEASYYGNVVQNTDSAIAAYQRVLDLDPFDWRALNNLGNRFNAKGRFDESERLYERSFEIQPSPIPLGNLAYAQLWLGKLDAAEATAKMGAIEFPNASQDLWDSRLGFIAYLRADYPAARSFWETQRDRAETPSAQAGALMNINWLLAVQGKASMSEPSYRNGADIFVRERIGFGYLRHTAWKARFETQVLGDPLRALRRVQEALRRVPLDSLEVVDRPYLALADFYVSVDSLERAKALLAEFEAANDPAAERWHRLLLRGTIALQEGRERDAVRELRASAQELGSWLHVVVYPELGRAYEAVGQVDSAIAAYERATERRGDIFPADAVWRPIVLTKLGELYEERSESERAISYYNEFVELWKDAAAELQPQVEDVRRRIAALVGESR